MWLEGCCLNRRRVFGSFLFAAQNGQADAAQYQQGSEDAQRREQFPEEEECPCRAEYGIYIDDSGHLSRSEYGQSQPVEQKASEGSHDTDARERPPDFNRFFRRLCHNKWLIFDEK